METVSFEGLLPRHNPHVGFMHHAPASASAQQSYCMTRVDYDQLKRLRNNPFSGTFHTAPGMYSALHVRPPQGIRALRKNMQLATEMEREHSQTRSSNTVSLDTWLSSNVAKDVSKHHKHRLGAENGMSSATSGSSGKFSLQDQRAFSTQVGSRYVNTRVDGSIQVETVQVPGHVRPLFDYWQLQGHKHAFDTLEAGSFISSKLSSVSRQPGFSHALKSDPATKMFEPFIPMSSSDPERSDDSVADIEIPQTTDAALGEGTGVLGPAKTTVYTVGSSVFSQNKSADAKPPLCRTLSLHEDRNLTQDQAMLLASMSLPTGVLASDPDVDKTTLHERISETSKKTAQTIRGLKRGACSEKAREEASEGRDENSSLWSRWTDYVPEAATGVTFGSGPLANALAAKRRYRGCSVDDARQKNSTYGEPHNKRQSTSMDADFQISPPDTNVIRLDWSRSLSDGDFYSHVADTSVMLPLSPGPYDTEGIDTDNEDDEEIDQQAKVSQPFSSSNDKVSTLNSVASSFSRLGVQDHSRSQPAHLSSMGSSLSRYSYSNKVQTIRPASASGRKEVWILTADQLSYGRCAAGLSMEADASDNTAIQNHYTFGSIVGGGTFATVKRATHNKTGNVCVIKLIRKRFLFTDEERVAVRREIDILRSLRHRNIARLWEVFEDPDYVMLAMEQVAGGNLKQYIDIGNRGCRRFPEHCVKILAEQLLEALDYLHNRKHVIHCDIKPENVLLARQTLAPESNSALNHSSSSVLPPGLGLYDVVKLADFGNARRSRDARYFKVTGTVSRVPFCSITGTVGYIAPEILDQRHFSSAVDVWSLGVMLYTLLAGYAPFGPSQSSTNMKADFTGAVWEDGSISAEAKSFVHGLLQRDPATRFTVRQARVHSWFRS